MAYKMTRFEILSLTEGAHWSRKMFFFLESALIFGGSNHLSLNTIFVIRAVTTEKKGNTSKKIQKEKVKRGKRFVK